jgi:hypothetical protein
VRMLAAELGRPRYGGSPNLAELAASGCPDSKRWIDHGAVLFITSRVTVPDSVTQKM